MSKRKKVLHTRAAFKSSTKPIVEQIQGIDEDIELRSEPTKEHPHRIISMHYNTSDGQPESEFFDPEGPVSEGIIDPKPVHLPDVPRWSPLDDDEPAEVPDPPANSVTVALDRGAITVDGQEYPAEAHWCAVVQALINEGGRNLTGPQLQGLHGCAGKKWSREFGKLKKAIPPLVDRIKSDGRKGYRIVEF